MLLILLVLARCRSCRGRWILRQIARKLHYHWTSSGTANVGQHEIAVSFGVLGSANGSLALEVTELRRTITAYNGFPEGGSRRVLLSTPPLISDRWWRAGCPALEEFPGLCRP